MSSIKAIKALGFPWETQDPFLFCVFHEDLYPAGNDEFGPQADLSGRIPGNDFQKKDGFRMYHGSKVPGFPAHPHRGFETVTIVNKGLVDHSDSLGAAGRFGMGDVQWMTAGKGVQHSEMFPLLNNDRKNELELFQIWLNLPAKDKFAEPHFKMLWHEDIPVIHGDGYSLKLMAGKWQEKEAPAPAPNSWAADENNGVAIMQIKLEPNAKIVLPNTSQGINRSIYFFKGSGIEVDDTQIQYFKAIELNAAEKTEIVNGNTPAEILLLQGKPIGEKVVQHGPFVMNTEQEIHESIQDFQKTQWGGWPWPTSEPVHSEAKGRFAKHADGHIEEKSL